MESIFCKFRHFSILSRFDIAKIGKVMQVCNLFEKTFVDFFYLLS